MRLILLDLPGENRYHFDPVALSRPVFELRCGMTSLAEKLIARTGAADVACFVPPYMANAYAERDDRAVHGPINDPATLAADDLLLVSGRIRADAFAVEPTGPSEAAFGEDGQCLFARIAQNDLARLDTQSIDHLLASVKDVFPPSKMHVATWDYSWQLVLENPPALAADLAAAGRSGIEGTVEQPNAIRGSEKDVYVAPGAIVHPMVVLDATEGRIFIDEGAEVHPFTRIEGPCYVGKKSILLGANCRGGNSIGPVCRVGGEVQESIIQGYSNKYHDGFLGHAYVGEWVNLGAMTTNSDLKNDYSNVSVVLDGRRPINTGSTKVGSLIGDHTKTAIGTLFNTGSYVGAMALIATPGILLPKFIPSFTWVLGGGMTKGFGRDKLFETAKVVMSRRGREFTPAQARMWNDIHQITARPRQEAVKKGRRAWAGPGG